MPSDPARNSAAEDQPGAPSETVRGIVSLLLFIHLFCVWVALSGNYARSALQARLLTRLRPYTQLLNFDLDFTPYYLTHATPLDVDNRIEILPEGLDAADAKNWIVLPDAGYRGGLPYKRQQRLADTMAFYAESEDYAGFIAQSVATNFMQQRQIRPAQIRCRRHLLQMREALSGTLAEQNPYDPLYFEVSYAANVVVGRDGRVSVVKIDEASQVARPDSNTN
jgi:hypothetical protein